MPEDETSLSSSLAAIAAAAKLYRIADDAGLVDRLKVFFKKKDRIVVLGSTGSGKTNMLQSLALAAGLVDAIPAQTRTEAPSSTRILIKDRPFVIVDTPGQAAHAPDRQRVIRESLAKPPVRVINVVSFGYHEYASGSGEAVTEDGMNRPGICGGLPA